MINSPTICQITVDRVLAPVRQSHLTVTIMQYMDDILIAAPSTGQVDQLVSTISEALKINAFEIASAKIKKGPCITFLGVGITSSYITPPQIKIRRDIKTLHDVQQLVVSLQWLRNIVLIPPEVMDPLNDLLKGKNPWEQKTLTLEAISSLNFIEHQMSCLSSLTMKGRKLTLRHLGIEPTKIYLPFCKQLSTQSTTIAEYLAMALAGFGGEIRYLAKPPWTQLLMVIDTDLPPKIID
ncbi:reverse transcriptase-like protein [Turdus rufiventris]|nr:reverse transcriptase-like protein [Turdus rufiventris]